MDWNGREEKMPTKHAVLQRFRFTLASFTMITAVAALHGAARAQDSSASIPTAADTADARLLQLTEQMTLAGGALTRITVEGAVGQPLRTTVEINSQLYTLDLAPHSVRSERFEVRAQLADGSYVTVDTGPARTLRGTVTQIEGSVVAASMLDDGLHARILLPDGDSYWIEPVAWRLAGAPRDEYIVYHSRDVLPHGGTCEIEQATGIDDGASAGAEPIVTAGAGSSFTAELAIDADVEYFENYGTVEAAVLQIEIIINVMNLQYMRDVAIRHEIGPVIVRTAEPDPYSSTDSGVLLGQLRTHWRDEQVGVQRDMVELFTGKEIDGNVIGIAFVSSVCSTSRGYSIVQSDYTSSFACKTDLSAHELGHNWGVGHCTCPGWTMNPSIQCANQFHPTFIIPGIVSHRNSRTCLDVSDGFVCPASSPTQADATSTITNRYLTFVSANPGEITAVQVTAIDLPPPHDSLNGVIQWLGPSTSVSESPGNVDPAEAPGSPSFIAARLRCDPWYADWSALGTVHVFGRNIVPGGTYELREVNVQCALSDATALAAPLVMTTSKWGDTVSDCQTSPCGPPDGSVDVTTDIVSILNKFRALPGAPVKSRVDLEPDVPDLVINITDLTRALAAFRGAAYPFTPSPAPCP